ncbi:Hypothetical predicted protein [Pelobates cultripes]|uniref:CAP-Gly domain-containing protein n=1 Tax=Pelobates cultripes TaxID=61616 RepID=A0AAD1T4Y3_PELCU|nr:Hypothetical predicted protein [Pelobates cultripes]
MSAKKDGTSFSIEDDSYTEDVSRAWDSLQEAKHVLQRIENKMSPEVHRRNWMLKTQRLLPDRDSFSGHDSCSTSINDQLLLGDIKEHSRRADETYTLDRFPDRDDTYDSSIEDIQLGCSGRNLSSKSSFFSERKVFPTDMDRRHIMPYSTKLDDQDWLPVEIHRTSGDISFLESNRSREDVAEDTLDTYLDEFSYPLTVQNFHSEEQNVPYVSAYHIRATLSPKRDLYTQKLDYLKNKSPNDKLERLKEKIREQKRRRNASRERLPNFWQAGATIIKPLLKRKVCKVTFAPPPPRNFKGISAQSKKTGRSTAEMRESRSRNEENSGNKMEVLPLGKPKNAIKKSPVFRKLSFESPSPEKKARSTDLYGASAWREGQKLVKKLLGPSPVVSKMLRVSQEDGGATMRAGSCKSTSQKTLLPSDAPVSHLNTKTFTQACRKPGHSADINLHSSTPEALQRNPKKENVAQGDEKQGRKHKIRSYSVEEVRDFMKKKNMERLTREREAQSLLQNAAQLRQKRLQAVFKKQKDAFPFRSDPKARIKYPQRKHCETTCLGSDEKGYPEWVHLKSLALLKEVDQSSRKGTTHANKEPIQDEQSSPLKLQDLDTFSMTLKKQIAEISSKNDGKYDSSPPNRDPSLSPYRDNQDRMKAIWAVAKELGERIEVEASRLGAKQIPQDSSSNPVPIHHTSPAKVSPTGSPNYRISRISPELSSIRHGKAAQPETERRRNLEKWRVSDSSLGTYTISTTSRNDNLPQTSGHVGSDTMMEKVMDREYYINKGYTDRKRSPTNKRHQDKKTRKDSPIRQSSSTSPQIIPTKLEPSWHSEKITGTEFISPKLDRKNSRTLRKVNKEEGLTSVHDLPQTKTDIVQTLKAQITQQKEELAILREKAKVEAEEAERCMEEMMKYRAAWPVELAELEVKQTAQPTPKIRHVHSDNCLGGVAYAAPSEQILIHDAVKDQRQNDKTYPVLQTDIVENEPVDDPWDQIEPATDSTSKWSEISEFYGTPNMFSRYSLEMAQQYLREEELRARHQTALLRLREEALKEKTRAELALLEHQRKCLELNNEHGNVEEILEQEHEVQENLKQEQAEIRHLSNIYKAAHQERKLLLKQQKDVLRIQQLAAHMKKKLYSACAAQQVPGDTEEQITDDTLCSSTVLSALSNHDTDADLSDHLADDDDFVEDRKQTYSGSIPLPDVSPTEDTSIHKETLPRHQDGAAEGYPSSGMEEPMMEAVENNLRKHHHKFPTAERKLCNHSQLSADDKELEVDVIPAAFKMDSKKDNGTNQGLNVHVTDTDRTAEEEDDQQNFANGNRDVEHPDHNALSSEHNHQIIHMEETPHVLSDSSAAATSNEFTQAAGNAGHGHPLAAFLKVSAKLIHISESSVSGSDKEEGAQDTESGDSEVFDMEPCELPCKVHSDDFEDPISTREPLSFRSNDRSSGTQEGQISMDPYTCLPDINQKNVLEQHNTTGLVQAEKKYGGKGQPEDHEELVDHIISIQDPKNTEVKKNTEIKPKIAPLASESFPTSSDLSETDTNTNSREYLIEEKGTNGVTNTGKLPLVNPKNIIDIGGIRSTDSTVKLKETNERPSLKEEKLISKKIEMVPSQAISSKDLFQIKSFTLQSEENVTFITDEDLQPIEDALSEILSPVDEMLSYESADLYSAKKDNSYPSEDLPSIPEDVESIKSNDVDSYDFPTPPEQIVFSSNESMQSSLEGSIIDEMHLSHEYGLTEEMLLPSADLSRDSIGYFNDQKLSMFPTEDVGKENLSKPFKIDKPFLTLSKAEEDFNDPLFTFDLGDRVLVKLSKPGTLKFKGLTAFEEGYWAGVALDKPEGDHNGTYEGITYFKCPMKCGVFVRPRQITHLLGDDKSISENITDNDEEGDDQSFDKNSNPSGNRSYPPKEPEEKESKENVTYPVEEGNKFRSCLYSHKSSCNIKVIDLYEPASNFKGLDIRPRGLNTENEDIIGEDKEPTWDLQENMIYSKKTKVQITLGDKKQTLVLRICEDLIAKVIHEAIWKCTRIVQRKQPKTSNNEYAFKTKKKQDENYSPPISIICSSLSTLEKQNGSPNGLVEDLADKLITNIIQDSIKEYKKLKRNNGNTSDIQSCHISQSFLCLHKDTRKNGALSNYEEAWKSNVMHTLFENLLINSLETIENIYVNKSDCTRTEHPEYQSQSSSLTWKKVCDL